jgi:hypothetical protein
VHRHRVERAVEHADAAVGAEALGQQGVDHRDPPGAGHHGGQQRVR